MAARVAGQQQRARQTREAILVAAQALFAQKGFAATTISEIAAAAGVGKGTVLAHFSEKLSIFATSLAGRMRETATAIAASDGRADGLVAALTPLFSDMVADPAAITLMTSDASHICYHDLMPDFVNLQAALVARLAAAGQGEAQLAAETLVAVTLSHAVDSRCRIQAGEIDSTKALAHLRALFSFVLR